MRFFAHDGKSTHGPAGIQELLKLPGFDGDTLVCPVGSTDTADWKPALAYPPFKKALLEALEAPLDLPKATQLPPMPAILPAAPAMPLPAPFPLPLPALAEPPKATPKTIPCPRCAHANLEEAHFCNTCGARMDGRLEELLPLAPVNSPKANLPPPPPPAPAPVFDSFAQLDPMLSYPTEPAPMALPESPRRPLQPGKMGQLGAIEESAPVAAYASSAPALAPELPPTSDAIPVWKRPAVLAAFISAAVVTAGLAYVMLTKKPLPETVAELTPTAQAPLPEPPPAPAQPLFSTPPATSSPAMPAPRAQKAPLSKKPAKMTAPIKNPNAIVSTKPKRARKPRPARAPKPKAAVVQNDGNGETLIESTSPEPKAKPNKGKRGAKATQGDKDPLLEALLTDATQAPAGGEAVAEPGMKAAGEMPAKGPPMIGQRTAANPSQFSMPGLKRPVSASDRAPAPQSRAPRPPVDEAAPTHIAGLDSPALAEPGKSPPPAGIEDEPVKSAEGDQLALVQVHEQFDFCAQLLAQGAYGDHYDTCLCKDTREAAPYRSRRGFYVSAKKKEASAGHLETTAKILSSKIDNGVAKVTARWKSTSADKGRDSSQLWKLEDGLWCQAP